MKRFFFKLASAAALSIGLWPGITLAHCPLCTVGAGIAAAGAAWLGVGSGSIGVFIGAFAVATGLWMHRLIKKSFFPHQSLALATTSFALTIIPMQPLFQDYTSLYISWAGDYGSWLNRTYVMDRFVIGALVGAVILAAAPAISRLISRARKGKMMPFQGITVTFGMLLFISVILQFSL